MKKHWIAVIALAILASVPRPVFGQAGYGSIGVQSRIRWAVVPNAKVTVTNTATSIATRSTSLGDGSTSRSTARHVSDQRGSAWIQEYVPPASSSRSTINSQST